MQPLTILFEDDFLVAIDKPPGMLVHPASGEDEPAQIAMKRLRDQLGRQVFPIHRLDRPTSGVLLFALDKTTASAVQQAFERRNVIKTYHAAVCGAAPQAWVCETPLRTNPEDEPLAARTSFERLVTKPPSKDCPDPLSLVKAVPTTGRFHQIRRHLLDAGFPIVGDFRYAGMEKSHELCGILGIGTRMLLQAKSLELTHPRTAEPLRIHAPADEDFLRCFGNGAAAGFL
ncbi:hypothetical protein JIN84_19395 [Luteolibacter yonseiensis]|uniref:tRNA pseudouridine synthase C n=1 Tax=Luteolibacter yonseiensis TaxID=1144680 RepID=A0A934VDQ7_9BACT|nr:pseudouridine synthase [Luteolibacter yonseiensis]MBK1817794.1 hypothetical protein [Luteolibacter yonseiensis]